MPAAGDKPRGLVVEDNPGVRLLAMEALQGLDFDVAGAADGESALRQATETAPDLVILDVRIPHVDGFEVCRRLRRMPACRHVPILMMTGLDDNESINEAFDAGATDFLTKPVNWTLFGHRVRYLMRAVETFAELRDHQARLAEAQKIARLGYFAFPMDDDRVLCSEELLEIFALSRSGTEDHTGFLTYVHPDDRDYVREAREAARARGTPYDIRYRMLAGDGTERFVNEQARLNPAEGSLPSQVVGAIQDLTERKKIEERVAFLAYRDSLTGLPNRRLFEERFRAALDRIDDRDSGLACLFIDLDRFKQINDTLGHTVGDQLLQSVSRRLRDSLDAGTGGADGGGPSFSIARFGGDEFIVLLEEIDGKETTAAVATELSEDLSSPFVLDDSEVFVTASIGIALCPDHGDSVDSLLRHADIAMYAAKDRGRNNFQFYAPDMEPDSAARLSLQSQLHRALEREELEIHYQPVYACRSGALTKVEALLRWRREGEGLVTPDRFISLAEETGLILPIGEWVLHTVTRDWRDWATAGLDPPTVAVNLSARQFQHGDVVRLVEEAVHTRAFPAEALELEITEGTLMESSEASIHRLDRLKATGVTLAVDDFGTGYSSLAYLKRFPLDSLKIDRSFVTDLTVDSDDARIVSAIIAMAHGLRLVVVAEGVENRAQLDFLRAEGCDMVQGFLLARPAPAPQIARWLGEARSSRRLSAAGGSGSA